MLYTTFELLRQARACTERYKVLAKALGSVTKYGKDTPVPLSRILETNGLDDALWSLRATTEDSSRFSRLLACEFAEHVLPIFEKAYPSDGRPRQAIATARRFANGQATEDELAAAFIVLPGFLPAWVPAWAAAWAAARAAAWVARDVARNDAEIKWQTETFLNFLRSGKWTKTR